MNHTQSVAEGILLVPTEEPNLPSEKVRIERSGAITTIVIDDVEARNALTMDMADDLSTAFRWATSRSRVIVIKGAGVHFCAGANRRTGSRMGDTTADAAEILQLHYHPIICAIAESSVPVITAVRGAAAGFGASLALAGDIVLAADDAFFLQAFRHMALIPDGGSAYFLERAVGRIRANALMLLGERLGAVDACNWGLVTKVISGIDFDGEVARMAATLAGGPTVALGLTRRMTWLAAEKGIEEVLAAEMRDQRIAAQSEDHQRAIVGLAGGTTPVFCGR